MTHLTKKNMDRMTSNLRAMLTGRRIMHKDLRNNRTECFKVAGVSNSERGYLVIKGELQFDILYVPYMAGEALLNDRYCIYRENYDTSVIEYEISICED